VAKPQAQRSFLGGRNRADRRRDLIL
jgi:hypothetical protein